MSCGPIWPELFTCWKFELDFHLRQQHAQLENDTPPKIAILESSHLKSNFPCERNNGNVEMYQTTPNSSRFAA